MDAHKIEYVNVVMDGEIESLHHIEEVRLICGWGCGWGWGWGWDWVLMEQWYCAWDELDELQTEITMLRKTFLERSWARWIDLRNDVIWLNELKHRLLMREEAEKIVRCLMFNLPSYGINAHYHHKWWLDRGPFGIVASENKGEKMNTAGNRFSIGESGAVIDIELMELLERNGKRMIQLKDNSTCNNNNVSNHKDFKPREGHQLVFNDTFNQHKRKKTAQHVSSFAMATIVFLWIVLDICSQLSMTPEHGPIVIWSHLLGLLGFMVFVWAVAIMILVGAQLSRMQCAMLVFWAILMLVRSVGSVQCT